MDLKGCNSSQDGTVTHFFFTIMKIIMEVGIVKAPEKSFINHTMQ